MLENYVFVALICVVSMLILIRMVWLNDAFGKIKRRFFAAAIISIIIVQTAEIGMVLSNSQVAENRTPYMIFCVLKYALTPLIPIMLSMIISSAKISLSKILYLLPLVNAVLTLISPWCELVFSLSGVNAFSRGSYYIVYILACLSSGAALLIETLSSTERFQAKNRVTLMQMYIFMLLGTLVQVIVPRIHTTWLCVAVSLIVYYAYFCELSEKYDPLTNLFNRRAYETELRRLESLNRATIAMFDIDDFKIVNDTYGHHSGDRCLTTLAGMLTESFGKLGVCCRIGGDEFCVLFAFDDMNLIKGTAISLSEKLAKMKEHDPSIACISYGIAEYDRSTSESIQKSVEEADRLLYNCKSWKKSVRNIQPSYDAAAHDGNDSSDEE